MSKNAFEGNLEKLLSSSVKTSASVFEKGLVSSVLAEVRSESRQASPRSLLMKGWASHWPMAVRYALPAVLLLLAVLMFWSMMGGRNGSLAFADVLEQIREFRPYACTFTYQYEDGTHRSERVMRDSLTRRREIREDGTIHVFDIGQRPIRVLTLLPDKKLASDTSWG